MSAPTIVWVVGEPGTGKTTLVREFLNQEQYSLNEKPKWTVGRQFAAAGHYNGGKFDGADTVPYNGVDSALEFCAALLLKDPLKQLIFFDGDRFSHSKVVQFFAWRYAQMACIFLTLPPEVALARRLGRGTNQNPTWVAGRRTKAYRFAQGFKSSDRLLELDGQQEPHQIFNTVKKYLELVRGR